MSLSQSFLSARHRGRWSLLAAAFLLSACSSLPQQSAQREAVSTAAPQTASTLGTQWGEGRESRAYSVQAQRIEPQRDELQLAYSDERSIRQALGQNLDAQRSVLPSSAMVRFPVTPTVPFNSCAWRRKASSRSSRPSVRNT